MDGSGPILKTRCLRGEGGGIEIQQGGERVISNSEGRLGLHPGAFITHDKGYYHSLRRSRKGTFRPYQTP